MLKRTRKTRLYSISIILVVVLGMVVAIYYSGHRPSAIERYHDRSRDTALINHTNARLDSEMSSDYKALSPWLASFGLHLVVAPKSSCYEGDPSLYKYGCSTSAGIDSTQQRHVLNTPKDAAQKLTNFDSFMSARGWKIGGNDFRSQQPQATSQWDETMSASMHGISIEYDKGECSLDFKIVLPYQTDSGGLSSLDCATELLPGFYY